MSNSASVAFMITQAQAIFAEFDAPDPLDFALDELTELAPEPAPTHRTPAYLPNACKTQTSVKVRTQPRQGRHTELLNAALQYAEHGLYIMPLHEPVFDNAGKLTGCTCEAHKRSSGYRDWLRRKGKEKQFDPNFKCRTPGKHPRITDWETNASKDPAQIRTWWGKWPTANIGLAVGKSDLITFDRDTYKKIYGDDSSLFSREDKETATQISQNSGEHVVFQMPAGKAYTNANNTLPPGIDIRGVGGMQVLDPSIGPSGNQWQWEDGYSILECTPKPLPQALQAILDAAHEKTVQAHAVSFTTPTTEQPNLIRWQLSKATRELINSAPVPGSDRSKTDQTVITALIYAGATDNDILAVFQNNLIGTAGKFAEAGPVYLAHSIGKARAFVAAHPRPDVGATITQLRHWIRTHSFADHIDPKLLASDGTYRTDGTDTKIADAIFDVMAQAGRLAVTVGKKRLGKLAGVSCNTALKSMARLNGWLFNVTRDPVHGAQVALVENSRLQQIDPLLSVVNVHNRDQSSANDNATPEINEYSPRKADEPFLIGTSKLVRDRSRAIALATDSTPAQAMEDYTFAAFGESGLRVIDALTRCGDMTAQELADETGKKVSGIRTAVRKLEQHGIVEAEREGPRGPKVYSLAPDVWRRIDELAPNLRTYTTGAQRENRRLKEAQLWAQRGQAQAQTAEAKLKFERRFAKLATQRIPHLARLLEDKATQAEIKAIAYTPGAPFGPHPAMQAKLERLHGQARMDLAEARRKAEWMTANLLLENIAALKASNTPKRQWFDMLTIAGFTPNEAKRAIKVSGG